VKALLEKNGLKAEDTDIDVVNGNLVEKAKADEKK